MAGRQTYSSADDRKLWEYLLQKLKGKDPNALNPKGNKLWIKAANKELLGPNRTFDSMRDRMRRVLLPKYSESTLITEDEKAFLQKKLRLPEMKGGKSVENDSQVAIDDVSDEDGLRLELVEDDDDRPSSSTQRQQTTTVSGKNNPPRPNLISRLTNDTEKNRVSGQQSADTWLSKAKQKETAKTINRPQQIFRQKNRTPPTTTSDNGSADWTNRVETPEPGPSHERQRQPTGITKAIDELERQLVEVRRRKPNRPLADLDYRRRLITALYTPKGPPGEPSAMDLFMSSTTDVTNESVESDDPLPPSEIMAFIRSDNGTTTDEELRLWEKKRQRLLKFCRTYHRDMAALTDLMENRPELMDLDRLEQFLKDDNVAINGANTGEH